MKGVRRHYDQVAREVAVAPDAKPRKPSRHHAFVLVSAVQAPTLRRSASPRRCDPTRSPH